MPVVMDVQLRGACTLLVASQTGMHRVAAVAGGERGGRWMVSTDREDVIVAVGVPVDGADTGHAGSRFGPDVAEWPRWWAAHPEAAPRAVWTDGANARRMLPDGEAVRLAFALLAMEHTRMEHTRAVAAGPPAQRPTEAVVTGDEEGQRDPLPARTEHAVMSSLSGAPGAATPVSERASPSPVGWSPGAPPAAGTSQGMDPIAWTSSSAAPMRVATVTGGAWAWGHQAEWSPSGSFPRPERSGVPPTSTGEAASEPPGWGGTEAPRAGARAPEEPSPARAIIAASERGTGEPAAAPTERSAAEVVAALRSEVAYWGDEASLLDALGCRVVVALVDAGIAPTRTDSVRLTAALGVLRARRRLDAGGPRHERAEGGAGAGPVAAARAAGDRAEAGRVAGGAAARRAY